jgi:serine/threonine-protein kinase
MQEVAPMPIDSVADLVVALRDSGSLRAAQLHEIVESLQSRYHQPRLLAKELMQRGWLTPFQLNQIFLGRGQELLLGPYLLLERIGEGGMGQVFKAWHRLLDRIVALKVIRKDKLECPEAVQRFQREIQASSRLSHPNIVAAFDADEVDGTRFIALEYVEGTDLNKMVKQLGPLPIAQACDYMRQAAFGLQHAFERGLVHRDIKPSNLLVTQGPKGMGSWAEQGVVKILDMGLVRMEGANEEENALTNFQATLGTPVYITPEQARDAHSADIRSDLYSLGCTFYCLLTGRVPFPGVSAMEKLLKHWMEEPTPIEELRPETPTELAEIIYTLMAKKPEERYQRPIDLIADLTRVMEGPSALGVSRPRRPKTDPIQPPSRVPTPMQETVIPASVSDTAESPVIRGAAATPDWRSELVQIGISAIAVMVLSVLIVLLLIFR